MKPSTSPGSSQAGATVTYSAQRISPSGLTCASALPNPTRSPPLRRPATRPDRSLWTECRLLVMFSPPSPAHCPGCDEHDDRRRSAVDVNNPVLGQCPCAPYRRCASPHLSRGAARWPPVRSAGRPERPGRPIPDTIVDPSIARDILSQARPILVGQVAVMLYAVV